MKKVVILGAGTGGTIMAARLQRRLDRRRWSITLVDENPTHYYQPGFLFIPFGLYREKDVVRRKADLIPKGVEFKLAGIEKIEAGQNRVQLAGGETLAYDVLVIATGAKTAPAENPGLLGDGWRRNIFDFYTPEGALGLHQALQQWRGGELVVHITEMPIKCPVAPLEFSFLADWWLTRRGVRAPTHITYVTPLAGAFTRQNCSTVLGYLLDRKKITMIPDFNLERVDPDARKLVSYEGREVPYDLLVTVPTNMGDPVIARSGLGDELNFVPTDRHTLQSLARPNIFVVGDATDVPMSKAGSVAHFQAEILTENLLRYIHGRELTPGYDGHANCFIETGYQRAVLIDFNYEVEPVRGKFPLPVLGPLSLLQESRLNHWGKLAFKWIYWNLLLKARPLPGIGARMSRAGKDLGSLACAPQAESES